MLCPLCRRPVDKDAVTKKLIDTSSVGAMGGGKMNQDSLMQVKNDSPFGSN